MGWAPGLNRAIQDVVRAAAKRDTVGEKRGRRLDVVALRRM